MCGCRNNRGELQNPNSYYSTVSNRLPKATSWPQVNYIGLTRDLLLKLNTPIIGLESRQLDFPGKFSTVYSQSKSRSIILTLEDTLNYNI